MPNVPDSLKGERERADYAVMHFWEKYDFCDTSLQRPDYGEQAFVEFFELMKHASDMTKGSALHIWLSGVSRCESSYIYFYNLASDYLQSSKSPVRDLNLYMQVARYAAYDMMATEAVRERARLEIKLTERNMPGRKAEDFTFRMKDGQTKKLSELPNDRLTLLFFYDPDCPDCYVMRAKLRKLEHLNRVIQEQHIQVVAVYTGGTPRRFKKTHKDHPDTWLNVLDVSDIIGNALYDLRSLPALYVLTPDKRVLLRNTSLDLLTRYLANQ